MWDTLEPLKDGLQELRLTRLCPECGAIRVLVPTPVLKLMPRQCSCICAQTLPSNNDVPWIKHCGGWLNAEPPAKRAMQTRGAMIQ